MGFFSKPKAPKPQPLPEPEPLPPPPERSDAETESLAEEQKKRFTSSTARGRASTFLTGGGVTEGTSAVRFLGNSSRT